MVRKHAYTSAKADGGDATLVKPSDWNADHIGSDIEDRELTTVPVVSTTTETTIYSHSLSAGLLGGDGGFQLKLAGSLLENVAGTSELRVKLGATTIFDGGGVDHTNSANLYAWRLVIVCMNVSATSQKWSLEWQSVGGQAGAEPNTGFARLDQTGAVVGNGYNVSAEDTTGALLFDVTWQWSASSASLDLQKEIAILTLLPKS